MKHDPTESTAHHNHSEHDNHSEHEAQAEHSQHEGHEGHVGHEGHEAHAEHSQHEGHAGHDAHAEHEGHDGHDAHAGHDPKQFRNWFLISLALTLPVVLYSHTIQDLFNFSMPEFVGSDFIPAILSSLLFFTGGRIFLRGALIELRAAKPGMMALISLALVVAFGYSLLITVLTLFNVPWAGMDFWWELATLITIMLLGHWIEMNSIHSAQNALGELSNLLPDRAIRVDGNRSEEVSAKELVVGDQVLIRPGAIAPADGVVIEGEADFDESMLTGESRPVAKSLQSEVIAGTINGSAGKLGRGTVTVRVTRVGAETALAGIVRLVAEAQASKSNTQKLADRAAGWLFWLALAASLITLVFWVALGTQTPDFVLERVVTVLVIACPHALGLAIPLVNSITTAHAARQGILIRNRQQFEAFRAVDVVLFDKTGTLTTGQRTLRSIRLAKNATVRDEREVLNFAISVEHKSEHPIAKALLQAAELTDLRVKPVTDFRAIPGVGVSARLGGRLVEIGGPALLTGRGINIHVSDLVAADSANTAGDTVVYLLVDGSLEALMIFGDRLRETSRESVLKLRAQRKRVAMVSGDAAGVVAAVAKELGIEETFAEVLPAGKSAIVERLQSDGSVVAFVGDGVNDAPALAKADVAIAIGAGTSVAIETAGIVLGSNDPEAVYRAISLSRRSYRKMQQNLWWAAGYNIAAIPLAAGALSWLGLVLTPALGAVLMSLSTLIVAANAQLLRRLR